MSMQHTSCGCVPEGSHVRTAVISGVAQLTGGGPLRKREENLLSREKVLYIYLNEEGHGVNKVPFYSEPLLLLSICLSHNPSCGCFLRHCPLLRISPGPCNPSCEGMDFFWLFSLIS